MPATLIPGGNVLYGVGKIVGWFLVSSAQLHSRNPFVHSLCVQCAGLLNVYLVFVCGALFGTAFVLLVIKT